MLQQLEEPIHPQQKKQVIDAIRASGLKVTPSEVAETANLPVLIVAQELNKIATETNAHLEVRASGGISYVFSPQFEQAYSLGGPKKLVKRVALVLANATLIVIKTAVFAGLFLIRISFGVLLLASVVALIALAIAAIAALLEGADSADGGGGGGGGGSGGGLDLGLSNLSDGLSGESFASQWSLHYWCFDWLWDWIFFPRYLWGPSYYSYGLFDNQYDYGYVPFKSDTGTKSDTDKEYGGAGDTSKKQSKPRTKFLDSCFFLLFGESDPNADIENRRWHDITRIIRVNQGVVVAEQLSPFVQGNKPAEDWMLPILLRFNGLPDVTDNGHIIYMFPAFMDQSQGIESTDHTNGGATTAGLTATETQAGSGAQDVDQLRALYTGHLKRQKIINQNVQTKASLEPYLQERAHQLLPESGEYESVYLFVGLAFVLSFTNLFLGDAFPLLHAARPFIYCIIGYSSLFIIFPGIRSVLNHFTNERISERNDRRLEASAQVQNPSKEIEQKLQEARCIALSSFSEGNDKVLYTTEKDLLDQQFEHPASNQINLQNLRSL